MTRYIIVALYSFLFAINASAQDTLSLAEYKQMALEHSQTLKSAQANLQSAKVNQKLSKRASLPNFDFNASYLYMADPRKMYIPGHPLPTVDGGISNIYSPEFTKSLTYHDTYDAKVGASLPLFLGGKLNYTRKITENAKNIAESNVELNKINILLLAEQQYWTLVSLFEHKKTAENSVKSLNGVVNDLTNMFENDILTKNEVLKAQVELNNAKLFLITISDNINILKMAINQSIGKEIETPLIIADSVIEIPTAPKGIFLDDQFLNNRQEIRILNQKEELNEATEKIVRSDYLPQLVSFANYLLQSTNYLGDNEDELTWNAGLSLSIPIFHWGERRLKIHQEKLQTESTRYSLDRTKELLTLEVKQAIFNLEEAYTKLDFTQEALVQAEENLKFENNKFKQEIITTTDFLKAQTQWQKAHADFVAAKTNVKIKNVLYKKAIGELQ